MKKFLSMILAILLVFSVMAPITVFAENGPYPNDFENVDLENPDIVDLLNLKMSAILFMDLNITEENIEKISRKLNEDGLRVVAICQKNDIEKIENFNL